MKLAGSHVYGHARDLVFDALLDPEVLSRTLPGCEQLEQTGENEYAGTLKMKVGPVQGVFRGKVQLTDIVAPESYLLNLEGNGAPGFMNGNGAIRLEEHAEGTELFYDIDAKVGGKIASIGQRLVESSAKVITRQGLSGLGAQLDRLAQERPGPPPAEEIAQEPAMSAAATPAIDPESAASHPDPEGPSQAEFATDFAKGMVEELVPSGSRWPLAIALLLGVVIVAAVYLRACA